MPWSKPCGRAWRRNVMITFLGQLATLALLSTLASWEPLGPNKGRTGLTNACAPGLPTRQSLCQTAIPAQTPVTREQLLLPSCTTLLTLLHCQVSRSVRVPFFFVGAGEGNSLAYQRRLQVPKLNGVQSQMGSRNLLTSGIDVSRDLLCELAIELFDIDKLNPCTCVPFVSFRYPKSV